MNQIVSQRINREIYGEEQSSVISLAEVTRSYERISLMPVEIESGSVTLLMKAINTTYVEKFENLTGMITPATGPLDISLTIIIPGNYPREEPKRLVNASFREHPVFLYHGHCLYKMPIPLGLICLYARWSPKITMSDMIMQTWNLLTYNRRLVNPDERDCFNYHAARWYKLQPRSMFPLDDCLDLHHCNDNSGSVKMNNTTFKFIRE
jgi:hypothetical protein